MFYRGKKIDLNWLCSNENVLSNYDESGRNHRYVKFLTCEKYQTTANKYSKNGLCQIVHGVRADKSRLHAVIDHLFSSCHSKIIDQNRLEELQEKRSNKHP